MPTLKQSKPPCKDCKIRYENCWGKCVDFLEYRKIHEAEKAYQQAQTVADSCAINSIEKIKREKRRRRGK